MADPDSAVEVHGTVAVHGTVTSNPDALVAQIERTRENLAQTIDTLAERVSPAGNMRRLRERALEQAGPRCAWRRLRSAWRSSASRSSGSGAGAGGRPRAAGSHPSRAG